jgi:Transglycosylase SLT domain
MAGIAAFPVLALCAPPSALAAGADCEQAGTDAERDAGVPAGLLLAIGRVESGRWDPVLRRTVPWPWTVDTAGQGRLFASKDDAVARVRELQAQTGQDLDVGCFQISLMYHPDAFATLEQAFDPRANARYAAEFLTALHRRLGSWEKAVAAYHSSLPDYGNPYRERVFADWMPPSGGMSANTVVAWVPAPSGIAVWTPSPTGTAPFQVILKPPTMLLPNILRPPR